MAYFFSPQIRISLTPGTVCNRSLKTLLATSDKLHQVPGIALDGKDKYGTGIRIGFDNDTGDLYPGGMITDRTGYPVANIVGSCLHINAQIKFHGDMNFGRHC